MSASLPSHIFKLLQLHCFFLPFSHSWVPTPFPSLHCHSFLISHAIFHDPFLSKARPNIDLIWHFLPHGVCFLYSFLHSMSGFLSECKHRRIRLHCCSIAKQNPRSRQVHQWWVLDTPQPGCQRSNKPHAKWEMHSIKRHLYTRDVFLESNLFLGKHSPAPHQQFLRQLVTLEQEVKKSKIISWRYFQIAQDGICPSFLAINFFSDSFAKSCIQLVRTHICQLKYNIYKSTTPPSQSESTVEKWAYGERSGKFSFSGVSIQILCSPGDKHRSVLIYYLFN